MSGVPKQLQSVKHCWKKLFLNRMVSAKERRPGFEYRSHPGATIVILCLGRKFSSPSELYQFLHLQSAEHCGLGVF